MPLLSQISRQIIICDYNRRNLIGVLRIKPALVCLRSDFKQITINDSTREITIINNFDNQHSDAITDDCVKMCHDYIMNSRRFSNTEIQVASTTSFPWSTRLQFSLFLYYVGGKPCRQSAISGGLAQPCFSSLISNYYPGTSRTVFRPRDDCGAIIGD